MSATPNANTCSLRRRHPAEEKPPKTNSSSPGSRAPATAQPTRKASPALPVSRRRARKSDVAREFGVSIRTVDKWIHEKKIPFVKISERLIRFDLDAVDRAINRYTIREVA